jgi:hypothetical protein
VYPEATPRRSAATARLDGAGRGLGGAGGREGSMGRTFAGAERVGCCCGVVAVLSLATKRDTRLSRGADLTFYARAQGAMFSPDPVYIVPKNES